MFAFFSTPKIALQTPKTPVADTAARELLDLELMAVGGGSGEVIIGMPTEPAPANP
jgi:hypothetical protein